MSDSVVPFASGAQILVVIVNYRSSHLAVDCLASLQDELGRYPGARVVVVENASGDDSLEVLQRAVESHGWGHNVRVVAAPLNGGFSYGNNQAIRPALADESPPDFVWLVNPDTQVRPGALEALLQFIEPRPQVGIVGSSFEDRDGEPWPYAFRFPSFLGELDQGLRWGVVSRLLADHVLSRPMGSEPERTDWLPGASMLIRREVFDRIGLMDEEYFLYYEETDFCLQAARAGFETWRVPASRVMHIAGQSTGVTGQHDVPKRLPPYWFESRTRYFLKNHGRLYGVLTDLVSAAGFALWRLRRPLQGKPDNDPPYYLRDLLRQGTIFSARPPTNSRLGNG